MFLFTYATLQAELRNIDASLAKTLGPSPYISTKN